jgi:hypothetical protein
LRNDTTKKNGTRASTQAPSRGNDMNRSENDSNDARQGHLRRRARRETLQVSLLALLEGLKLCEEGARRFSEGFRSMVHGAHVASSFLGGIAQPEKCRRAPIRIPVVPLTPCDDLDRERARAALVRANLHIVKRKP